MPLYDYYVRTPDGQTTGPHPPGAVVQASRSGTLGDGATFARVLRGKPPAEGDFRAATPDNVEAWVAPNEPAAGTAGGSPTRPGPAADTGGGWMTAAAVLGALAVALVAFGLFSMYDYQGGVEDPIYGGSIGGDGPVGGDAYNYIIRANWGAGWVTAGVALGALSAAAALAGVRKAVLARP